MEKTKLHPASHCPMFVFSRSNGRSSVGAAAYAARTRMTDHRTGLIHNYSRVPGLLGEGLVNWNGSPEELWNAAEATETRINSRVARELRPALPAELPLDEQRRLVHGFCCWLNDQHGIAAHWVIHAPNFHDTAEGKRLWKSRKSEGQWDAYFRALSDPDRTNLNFHAHIRLTVRRVDKATGTFGEKTREFDRTNPRELSPEERRENREPSEKLTGREVIKNIRNEWERRTNASLKRVGADSRIDLRSYEAMAAAGEVPEGLEAQEHLGPRNAARARIADHPIDPVMPMAAIRNAERQQRNVERWTSWLELRQLARERARLEGDSERIARENEQQRRDQVQADKKKIRGSRTAEERAIAISEAGAIDAPDADLATDAAIAWAKTPDAPPEDPGNAFDQVVDLEAEPVHDGPPPPGEALRVRRVVRERQRVKN